MTQYSTVRIFSCGPTESHCTVPQIIGYTSIQHYSSVEIQYVRVSSPYFTIHDQVILFCVVSRVENFCQNTIGTLAESLV